MATLPVTVIGGYLGAGKTTLVNHLLWHANGRRLAVLVNEFGALPIDEDLIEAQDDDLISIAGGCICCTFGSDLSEALIALAGRFPRPDHVLIESSGVAMPGAIGASIGLLDEFSLAAVVVLADSETVRTQAADEYLGDTTLRQISDAHLLIQTKTDLVGAAEVEAVDTWLASVNGRAARVQASHGVVPIDVVLGQAHDPAYVSSAVHADAAFESRVFTLARPCDPVELANQLSSGAFGVVRGKGFVCDHAGQRHVIQTVGARAQTAPFDGEVATEVVCIGLRGQLDHSGLVALFEAL